MQNTINDNQWEFNELEMTNYEYSLIVTDDLLNQPTVLLNIPLLCILLGIYAKVYLLHILLMNNGLKLHYPYKFLLLVVFHKYYYFIPSSSILVKSNEKPYFFHIFKSFICIV